MLFLASTLCVLPGLGPAVYSAGLLSIQATLYGLYLLHMHSNFTVAPAGLFVTVKKGTLEDHV